MRKRTALLALALLLGSCGDERDHAQGPSPTPNLNTVPPEAAGATAAPAGRATTAPRGPGAGPKESAAPAPAPAPGAGGGQPTPGASKDSADVGENANVYLRDATPKLVVELDVVTGSDPTQASLDHLRSVMSSVLSKPGGVEFRTFDHFASTKPRYATKDLEALETAHRQTHSTPVAASLYILFVNGEYAERGQESAIAVAYSASAFAVFEEQVRSATTALVSRTPIERAVLVHELGHLLRLVNIGYRSPREREDLPDHPSHSRNRSSVMYYAVEDVSVASVLGMGPPGDFDADDRADLADLKAGRL